MNGFLFITGDQWFYENIKAALVKQLLELNNQGKQIFN